MKKLKGFLFTLLGAAFIFTGCVSFSKKQVEEKQAEPEVSVSEEIVENLPEIEPEIVPEDPPNVIFVKLLQEELNNKNMKGAIQLFDQIPEELSNDLELKMLLASLYYSDSQFNNAIEVANKVLEIDEKNLDALELISLCNHATGDKNAYKATADKILATDPYNASVNIQKAGDYMLSKKYKQARDCYRQALKGDGKNKEALFGFGQTSYYLDDLKTASSTFQKILDSDPEYAPALSFMGKIVAESENYLKAANYIKQALAIDDENYDYWMDYGTYLRYLGKFSDAEAAWKKAVDLDPEYFLAYAYLAGNYDDRNMYQEALDNYRMVIKTNPKYYFAYEEAAILEYHLGNYKNAIVYFDKAYEYSKSWCYKLMVYSCYHKMGDTFHAKENLQGVLKTLDKNSAEYSLVRFFNDAYSKNAESALINKIVKEDNSTKRGKMLFYMGLYCELNKADSMAADFYSKVTAMQAPMFFEYRIAEWSLGL